MEKKGAFTDWVLLGAIALVTGAGLVTMYSFVGDNAFFERQMVWALLGFAAMLGLSVLDFRFLRRTGVILALYGVTAGMLLLLFAVGSVFQGAQSWFSVGALSLQPSDPAKIAVIALLAKYFSRRHIEIRQLRHLFISGAYVFFIFLLVFVQPDFGSALIIASLWLGMVLIAGISLRHLSYVLIAGVLSGVVLWLFVFEDYQRERLLTFLNPYTDLQGAGYNAYQSTVAVGSGRILGKGVGYGTQSKLHFLPEYETDFIFAAFAEEWGFVGTTLLLLIYGVIIWRIVAVARRGQTNFEMLFCAGVAILFISQIVVHAGMNIGLLPVTGTTIPFMSYGGSHYLTESIAVGIVLGMRRYARVAARAAEKGEDLVPVPAAPEPTPQPRAGISPDMRGGYLQG